MPSRTSPWFWLSLIVLSSLGIAFWNYSGITLSDEYLYTERAWAIATGTFELTPSAFDNRLGWLALQAVSLATLGTGTIAVILPGLFALAILTISVWWIGNDFHPQVGLIAAGLIAFNPALLQLASDVSPDLLMTAFAAVGIGCIYYRTERPMLFGLLAAIAFGLAFLTKISVLYLAPWLLVLAVIDWKKGRARMFWGIFGGAVLVLGIGYLWAYHTYTGDALYRWHGIQDEHHVSEWGYYGKPWQELLLRATIYPVAFLLGSGALGYFVSLLVPGLFFRKWTKQHFVRFWGGFVLLTMAVHWWGSTSFSTYNPVLLFDRMWLLLTPGLALLAAVVISAPPKLPARARWWIAFSVVGLIGAQAVLGYRFSYFWLTGLVALWWIIPPRLQTYRLPALLAALLVAQALAIRVARQDVFFAEQAFFAQLEPTKKILIVSDSILYSKPLVHRGFSWPEEHSLIHWHAWKEEEVSEWDEIWLLFNPEREAIMSNYFGWPIPPIFRREVGEGHQLVIRKWED